MSGTDRQSPEPADGALAAEAGETGETAEAGLTGLGGVTGLGAETGLGGVTGLGTDAGLGTEAALTGEAGDGGVTGDVVETAEAAVAVVGAVTEVIALPPVIAVGETDEPEAGSVPVVGEAVGPVVTASPRSVGAGAANGPAPTAALAPRLRAPSAPLTMTMVRVVLMSLLSSPDRGGPVVRCADEEIVLSVHERPRT